MIKEQSNLITYYHTNINDRHLFPDCRTRKVRHSYDIMPLIIAGVIPHQGYTTRNTTNASDVNSKYIHCLVKNQTRRRTMTASLVKVCAPIMGLRVTSCCRSLWPRHRLSPTHPLLCTCSCCHSLPASSLSSSSRTTK